jgi:hypothetical protein
LYADYAEQQRRANDLLERTAALVGAAAPSAQPIKQGDDPTGPGYKLEDLLKAYPDDPWDD